MSDILNKNQHAPEQTAQNKGKGNKFLVIFVCAFLSLVLIFGATLGTITGVKNSRAAVKYEGLVMTEELASFFASYYKAQYMSRLRSAGVKSVYDTENFWSTKANDEYTYGQLLIKNTKEYLAGILAANYLFDSRTKLSKADKEKIAQACRDMLANNAEGSESVFDGLVSEYGFSYSEFEKAATMLYKLATVTNLLFGYNGAYIKDDATLSDEYLKTYSHVKLLVIRTETDFLLDENGNRVIGEDGNDETYVLPEADKAERQRIIEEVRTYIKALEEGGDVQMSPIMFDNYIRLYDDSDASMHADGYYFNEKSDFTASFVKYDSPEIVEKALSMNKGEYAEVVLDYAVCFIYKYDPSYLAYSGTQSTECFTDFYKDAAVYFFDKYVAELSAGVIFTEKYNNLNPIKLPYNAIYYPRF